MPPPSHMMARGNQGRWNPVDQSSARGDRGAPVMGRGFHGAASGPPIRGGRSGGNAFYGPRGQGAGRAGRDSVSLDGRGGYGPSDLLHAARGAFGLSRAGGSVVGGRMSMGHSEGNSRGARGGRGLGGFYGGGRGMPRGGVRGGQGGRFHHHHQQQHSHAMMEDVQSYEDEVSHSHNHDHVNVLGAYHRMAEENEYEQGQEQEYDFDREHEYGQGEGHLEYSRLAPPPPPPLPPPIQSDASTHMSYESLAMHEHHPSQRNRSQPPLPPPDEKPPLPPSYHSNSFTNEEASIHSSAGSSIHHHGNSESQVGFNYTPSNTQHHPKRFDVDGGGSGRAVFRRGASGRGRGRDDTFMGGRGRGDTFMSGRGRGDAFLGGRGRGDTFMGERGRGDTFMDGRGRGSSLKHLHVDEFQSEDHFRPSFDDPHHYGQEHENTRNHTSMMETETRSGRDALAREDPRGILGRGRMSFRGGGVSRDTTLGKGRYGDPSTRAAGRDGGRMGGRLQRSGTREIITGRQTFRGGGRDGGNINPYHVGRGYGSERSIHSSINGHNEGSDIMGDEGGYASLANHDEHESYYQQGQGSAPLIDEMSYHSRKSLMTESIESSPAKSPSKSSFMDPHLDETLPSAPPSPILKEEAHIVPPSPPAGPPSSLAVEMFRMYDLTSQMEFQYAKHLQNMRDHETVKAKYELLKVLPIGIDAFRDLLLQDEVDSNL